MLTFYVVALLTFQAVAFATYALKSRRSKPRDIRIATVRIVLDAVECDRVLGELAELARRANPDSRAGRANLVHEVARVLSAAQPSWQACAIDISPPASRRDASRRLDRLVHELRLAGERDAAAAWFAVAIRGELATSPVSALAQLATAPPDDVTAAHVVAAAPRAGHASQPAAA